MEMQEVPQVNAGTDASKTPDAQALSLPDNTQEALQQVAKEMGVSLDADGNVADAAPPQPEVPDRVMPGAKRPQMPPAGKPQTPVDQAEGQPPTDTDVPAKFQNPDGSANVEKLEKSSLSLDQAIAAYKAKEKEFQTLQNRVNNPPQQIPQGNQTPTQTPQQAQLSPLEIQMAQDLMAEAAAQGQQMHQAYAIAQARVMARGLQARYNAELNATEDLRQRLESHERTRELQSMIEADPTLASPEMAKTLWEIRQNNPHINQAPEPWKAAYIHYRGTQGFAQQVQMPTPKGSTERPQVPVDPVTRVTSNGDLKDRFSMEKASDKDLEAAAKKAFPHLRLNW